ncbi:hypothetical protein GPJ59_36520, partial [Streptomyces bambusae]|nr:hypothetical protein [Streptomyces bambusae]
MRLAGIRPKGFLVHDIASPAPHVSTPHVSAPRASAPHVSAPHIPAPGRAPAGPRPRPRRSRWGVLLPALLLLGG